MSSETLQPFNGNGFSNSNSTSTNGHANGSATTQTKTKAEVDQLDEQLKKSKYEPAFHGDVLLGVSFYYIYIYISLSLSRNVY